MHRAQPLILDAALIDDAGHRLQRGEQPFVAAHDRLLAAAERALALEPPSVVQNPHVAPSGDPHDYQSFGTYWWPDPDSPDGLPYQRRDGEPNPEHHGASSDRPRLERLCEAVRALALAHRLDGAPRYAERAALLLRHWFLDPTTRMNPQLRYGQAIPGRCDGRGIGIIDTACLVGLLDHCALIADADAWSDADQAGLRDWIAAYRSWLCDSELGQDEAGQRNNHGSWYDLQVAAFACFVGDRALAERTVEQSKAKRIDTQVAADGSQPHELARTRSWDYSLLNLAALFGLARIGERLGVELWDYRGPEDQGLRAAVDHLLPYADPDRAWPHQQITESRRERLTEPLLRAWIAYRDERYYDTLARLRESAPEQLCWLLWGAACD